MTTALTIENLSKEFKVNRSIHKALSNLELTVSQHDIFGFLGPNGAGKSTTIKIILSFLKASQGSVTVFDKQVGKEEYRHKIGYLSEFPFFYDHLTAEETLKLSGQLSGLSNNQIKHRIPLLLDKVNLLDAQDTRIKGYSKGMKQRLGMANALIHDPELLIFDEPMSGLDPIGRFLVKELIIDLKKQGKTIFFSSHILSDIEELCDCIAIIHKGNLLFNGKLDELPTPNESLEVSFVSLIEEADNARNA